MLEKICTDLKTSKKLKELGFEVKTDFYWIPCNKNDIPAYTLEHIISELPRIIEVNNNIYHITISQYSIYYINRLKLEVFDQYQEDNLATAAAKLWIKLKEDKII
jgi:hypothetical protein